MQEKEAKNLHKYVFWAAIIILVILSFLIIKPFVIPLISAFILAYLSKPLHNYLSPKIGKSISALICIFLIVLIIILPLAAIIGGIIKQATIFLNENNLKSFLTSSPILQKLNIDISAITEKSVAILISLIKTSFSYLPSIIIAILVTLFGTYYILVDWDFLALKLEKYLPFENKKRIKREMAKITNTIVYGTILIALIEFIIAFNGFLISGVKAYLLLPLIIFFFAFIPGLGPTIVWIPMALYYLFTKSILSAIGVTITGLVLSIPIDTILRAKILGDNVKINPLIMLVGILGGISLFGIFGFIIGPIVLIYTLEILEETLS